MSLRYVAFTVLGLALAAGAKLVQSIRLANPLLGLTSAKDKLILDLIPRLLFNDRDYMLKSMQLRNLTVFPETDFTFGKNLNVIIGENGSGKSHILKAAYSVIAVSAQRGVANPGDMPAKSTLEVFIAEKLRNVFRPDELGRLTRRAQGHTTCEMDYRFDNENLDISFRFSTRSKSEVTITKLPTALVNSSPVFLPTRELLTIYPGFVSLYENNYTQFEETWRDTCVLLGKPLARGARTKAIKSMLSPLEEAMGGSIELDKSGDFYLNRDYTDL